MVEEQFDSLRKNNSPEISSRVKDCSYPNVAAQSLKEIQKRIGKIFFPFLWNGKPDPITCQNSYQKLERGGISRIIKKIHKCFKDGLGKENCPQRREKVA